MLAALDYQNKGFMISVGIILSAVISYLTVTVGMLAPIVTMAVSVSLVFLIIVFRNPFIGLITLVGYSMSHLLIGREIDIGVNYGYIVEVLYIVVWVAIVVKTSTNDWRRVYNDLTLLFVLWFAISVLELLNPSGASVRGWLHEIRTSGLDSFILIPAGFLVFRQMKHLNLFLIVVIAVSLLATVNGIKQVKVGLFPGEYDFLLSSAKTHLIWGKLRVFSFYRDAGQFGASQASLAVICGVLAVGPYILWKRVLLALLALIFFYGMLISGTRGALYALVPGLFLAIFLFKNIKLLLAGFLFLLLFISVLKFTHIGSGNYHVHRLRSALNPQDASLNVRFHSQAVLADYLKTRPFGEGLGVIGYAGKKYNAEKFISTIPPDSYWVKVWAMYGIVGFLFWFSMMMYVIGKGCGIIWKIRDAKLKVKLIALISGVFGIFVCSYGNEVINALPSSVITYLSMVFVFLGRQLDTKVDGKFDIEIKM